MESLRRKIDLMKSSLGYDITDLMENKDVVEIMLNCDKKLWVDTHSKGRYWTGIELDHIEASNVVRVIASAANEVVEDTNPIISAELLEYGSRFEGILPPIVENPVFTIRKKAILVFTLEDYVKNGIMTEEQSEKIKKFIKDKKNILIVGGTGSGKTTLTNAIIQKIGETGDRLVILEDTKEIQSTAEDTVFLRTSPFVTMQKLLKSTMRLRPDRICVGEIRGGEALDLLKAWNSGHPGGVCTVHADSAIMGLKKLEQYICEVSSNPQKELIARTVGAVIVIKRKGLKRVIEEIKSVEYENGEYKLQDL